MQYFILNFELYFYNGSIRRILTRSCTITPCVLSVPFLSTCSILYAPSLGADNLHRRPGFHSDM
jgi:hypothetical protein